MSETCERPAGSLTSIEFRNYSAAELSDRADALEEELALVRALLRVRSRQEEEQEKISAFKAKFDAKRAEP